MSPYLRRKYSQFIIAWTLGIGVFVPLVQLLWLLVHGQLNHFTWNDYFGSSGYWLTNLVQWCVGALAIALGFLREFATECWQNRKRRLQHHEHPTNAQDPTQ